MNPSSAMSNVTQRPTAGDQVILSAKGVVTSGISDTAYKTVQLYLYQQTQGQRVCVCRCMVIKCEKNRHSVLHSTIDFIRPLPYTSTPSPLYHRFYTILRVLLHPFINPPPLPKTHTHTSHSGLYQNLDSRVCEPCDAQCVEGCSGGTVRLTDQLNFTQYC